MSTPNANGMQVALLDYGGTVKGDTCTGSGRGFCKCFSWFFNDRWLSRAESLFWMHNWTLC